MRELYEAEVSKDDDWFFIKINRLSITSILLRIKYLAFGYEIESSSL
jgi:hypothetical protein